MPIDRHDIVHLASSLDDIIDSSHTFDGFGPSLGAEVRRNLMDSGLSLYANGRGTLLFGGQPDRKARELAERRIYPAIDVQRSSTRKEDLLLNAEELNRVYLLRNFLADMPPVEAIEFLLERMKRTKNNKEFFATMAQG